MAKTYDIGNPLERLQKIADAVVRWPDFAKEAGVGGDDIRRIQAFHPAWVATV